MDTLYIYKFHLYDYTTNNTILDDFVVNINLKDFLKQQSDNIFKILGNHTNYKYYDELFNIAKHFDENYFVVISKDYNNIDYEDYDWEFNYNSDQSKIYDLECEAKGCKKYKCPDLDEHDCEDYGCNDFKHKCSKGYDFKIFHNKLNESLIQRKTFDVMLDGIKYEVDIDEAYIQIMVRNQNDHNFSVILRINCHKFLFPSSTLFDYNDDKLMYIDSRNCVDEHKKKLIARCTYPYMSWITIKESMEQLSTHCAIIEGPNDSECKTIQKMIDYINTLKNQTDEIIDYQYRSSSNTEIISNISINNNSVELFLNWDELTSCDYYLYINCKMVNVNNKKNKYLQKAINYFCDLVIIT